MIHLKFDGFRNGFMCFINKTEKCLIKNGNKLFPTLESLKAAITKAGLKHKEYSILVSFISADKKKVAISYNDVMKLSDGKYVFFYKDEKYFVEEVNEEIIIGAGYLVTKDGDQNLISDFKEGIAVYKNLTNKLYSVCKELALYPVLHLKIYKTSWKRFCIGFNDSTVKITFLDRDIMVKSNQLRITEGKKVFPFVKTMDKYSTMYAYITCDNTESGSKSEPLKLAYDFLDYICQNINNAFPEMKAHFENVGDIKTDMIL